jgi:hypothetical protein
VPTAWQRQASAHRDADIGALERGRVVGAVACHGRRLLPAVDGVDHADLGLWCATRDNKWQIIERIDLGISQGVELLARHDSVLR